MHYIADVPTLDNLRLWQAISKMQARCQLRFHSDSPRIANLENLHCLQHIHTSCYLVIDSTIWCDQMWQINAKGNKHVGGHFSAFNCETSFRECQCRRRNAYAVNSHRNVYWEVCWLLKNTAQYHWWVVGTTEHLYARKTSADSGNMPTKDIFHKTACGQIATDSQKNGTKASLTILW